MDGPKEYYAKWNKSERDTHTNTVYFHLHVESTKTKNRNRLIDTENKLIVAREKGDGGSVKEVKGVCGINYQLHFSVLVWSWLAG